MLKAIELEPDWRYDSVEQFADDVRRVIAGEPVRAKPPTWIYRTRRFVRRHRVSVAAASAAVVLLAATAGVLAWQRIEIGRERDRAREAEARAALDARAANQVTDFLIGLFELAGPEKSGGRTVTAREVLDEGAARVRMSSADAPLVRARLLHADGRRLHADGAAPPGRAAPARRAGDAARRRRSARRRPVRDACSD